MLTRDAFAKGLRALLGRFPKGSHPTGDALDWYYHYLKHRLTDDQFLSACERAFAELDRFPKPSLLYELAPHHVGDRLYTDEPPNPFVPKVLRIRRGSKFHRDFEVQLERRREAGTVIPRTTRDGYAVAQYEIVDDGGGF